jgi:PAS domain S-box-containing protein
MQGEIVAPVCAALTIALGVSVGQIRDAPGAVQHEALLALPGRAAEPVAVRVGEERYLACRYHSQFADVLIVGPFRAPDDPPSELVTLDANARTRVAESVREAVRGLGEATSASRQRVELASQQEVISRSILAITSALSIDTVLNRIVDLARELSGARYAALGVPGPDGELQSFLTSGLTEEEEASISHRPRGRGLLGLLLREPRTIRLANLHEHPASAGFPENHPEMNSFLGVPIMSRGEVVGNLYLTEKRTGAEFTADDARLVEILARHAAVAIENARLYLQLEGQQQRLQLILDQLPEAAVLAESDPERITLANRQAAELLGWTIETPMALDEYLDGNPRVRADGMRILVDDLPVVRSLRNGETVSRSELLIVRPDGQRITVLVNSVPLRGPDGRITGSITVFQDITQIKDAEQLKDDFLSLVSHELRTPLTTIQGGALLLRRNWDEFDHATQQEFLADIASESRRLGSLIENMVQLANIRAGRMRMETEPVHVRRLIEGAMAAVRQFAPEREVTLDIAPGLLAEADPDSLDQVVRNVLHNAIKYSPADRPIEITAGALDGMVQICVRDYGPGIDAEDVPRLFDRFSRTGSAIASGEPGMGLGLYLSRHVIEAHGGTIWIERPDDGGTRLVFTVPGIVD